MIQSSLVSASKCVQLSLSKSIIIILRTAEKVLKKMWQNIGQTSGLFAGRESVSEAEPLIGELHEAWSVGESTSCADRKQNQNRQWLTRREHCWNMAEFYETTAARTLYDVTEVTVVGAVIKQAVPECGHGWSLNSTQIQKVNYIYSILFSFFFEFLLNQRISSPKNQSYHMKSRLTFCSPRNRSGASQQNSVAAFYETTEVAGDKTRDPKSI